MTGQQEQILLFRIRKFKDERAFERLLLEYRQSLYRFLRAKLPTQEDTDDALSTVLLNTWSYLTSTHETKVGSFGGLLFHIGRNKISDFYRSRKQTVSIDDLETAGHVIEDKTQTEERTGARTDLMLIKDVVGKLKPEQQDIIVLRYFQELSFKEIARKLEMTEPSARVVFHRAVKELRKLL